MNPSEVTLYSGGARGAEEAFGAAAARFAVAEVNLTFEGHHIQRALHTRKLTTADLAKSDVSMTEVSKRLHRDYSSRPWMRQILQSIWHQVNAGLPGVRGGRDPLGRHREGRHRLGSGAGQDVQPTAARLRPGQGPLVHLEETTPGWSRCPVIDHKAICGTGTRNLNEAGQRAVDDLFQRSFGG